MCVWFGATLSGWRNSDGLCCELLVKISCVRLRGNLGLKRRDKLLEERRHTNISAPSISLITALLLMTIYKVFLRWCRFQWRNCIDPWGGVEKFIGVGVLSVTGFPHLLNHIQELLSHNSLKSKDPTQHSLRHGSRFITVATLRTCMLYWGKHKKSGLKVWTH